MGWSFSEDTPDGSSGLLGFGNSSRTAMISFDLPCRGRRRVLVVGYLNNYRGMGAAKVEVRGSDTDPEDESGKGSNDCGTPKHPYRVTKYLR